MMFPTTIVLGFLFLGLATSATTVATVIPATLIPLGIVVCSSVIYIQAATFYKKRIPGKGGQMLATFITSSAVWFIIVLPIAVYRFAHLTAGILGYFLLALLAHYILNNKSSNSAIQRHTYNSKQILLRACFVGSVIAIVVLLGKTLNPFWGGIFTMFPAATFASLITLHFYYEPEQLYYFMRRAPLGSLALVVYALTAMVLFPRLGIAGGTLAAYVASGLCSALLIRIQKRRLNT
jgi:hypothetical protein